MNPMNSCKCACLFFYSKGVFNTRASPQQPNSERYFAEIVHDIDIICMCLVFRDTCCAVYTPIPNSFRTGRFGKACDRICQAEQYNLIVFIYNKVISVKTGHQGSILHHKKKQIHTKMYVKLCKVCLQDFGVFYLFILFLILLLFSPFLFLFSVSIETNIISEML